MSSQCCAPATSTCDICHQAIPKHAFEHTQPGHLDSPSCVFYTPCCDKTVHGPCHKASIREQQGNRHGGSYNSGQHDKTCQTTPCRFKCGFLADSILACEALHYQPASRRPSLQYSQASGSSIRQNSVTSPSTLVTTPRSTPSRSQASRSSSSKHRSSRSSSPSDFDLDVQSALAFGGVKRR